jgi:hypothetical protein
MVSPCHVSPVLYVYIAGLFSHFNKYSSFVAAKKYLGLNYNVHVQYIYQRLGTNSQTIDFS